MKGFSKFILKLFGWNINQNTPDGVAKAVIAVGPHTSNWDFIIGRLAFSSYGIKPNILIKKELFFFPLGPLLKAIGGVPVDRKTNNRFTDQAIDIFNNNDHVYMVFTPEGTRSYNPNWKKGFYYIAKKANVPIYICYIDYANKTGGFYELFQPTGDRDKDISYIKQTLSQFKGKYPENGIKPVEDE